MPDTQSKALPSGGQGGPVGLGGESSIELEDLRLIQRAVRNQWAIPENWAKEIPNIAAKMAADETLGERERLRAIEVLAALKRDNIGGLVELIKTRRLINGESTENVTTTVKVLRDVTMDDL